MSIPVQASDPDGDELTYELDGAPAGLSIDPQTGLISGTVADGAAGNYTVTVTVTDPDGATDSTTFAFTVTEPENCSPISPFTCPEVLVDQPFNLTFDGTEGGLVDGDGDGTGFTMVDDPSSRLDADGDPFDPDVPGYEPSLLNVDPAAGTLTIEATQGIQYKTNDSSTNTNSLINAIGVGVNVADLVTTVSTTVVSPDFDGSADSEQGGLYFGLDEDNLVKLVVVNRGADNVNVQLQKEVNGQVVTANDELNSAEFAEGQDVMLTLVLDDSTNTATGSYQIAGGPPVPVGTLPIPQEFLDGDLLPDGVTGPASFAGVFATARNEATNQVLVTFADFSVTSTVPSDNTAPEIILTGDRTLFENQELIIPIETFDEDGDAVTVAVTGLPPALTYTDSAVTGNGDISGTVAEGAMTASPYEVQVTATDGTDSTTASFTIEVIDDVAIDVNFQLESAPTPLGYLRDFGQAYAPRSDDGQGTGLTFGWVAEGTTDPRNMVGNGRDRNRAGIPQLQDTFIHMQYGDIGSVFGGNPNCTSNQCQPGAWEIEVPNGLYEVTVSVGDQPSGTNGYDSLHAINLEAGYAILAFQGTGAKEYLEATAFAGVEDGRLTVDAIGGTNTKINYVEIRSVGTRPMVTGMIPPNRDTDVVLNTSISASISVPGSGIGVNPDRQTSLTDEAVKLFEITDTGAQVEVAGNRGSTGGNDTIAFSPLEPLKDNTTYIYVIDGVLDEAGNEFGRFQSTFTTGTDPGTGGGDETFTPVEGVNFDKVLLPTASGDDNGKFFASLTVHDDYLWATTIGQGMYRYLILPDGTLGPEQDLNLFKGRAAVGLLFDETDSDIAYVTHATANLSNESARIGSKLSMIDFSDVATPVVTDLFVNLPRSQKDHLSNSIAYGPSGDGGAPWLYFLQGSNTAAGDTDSAWGNRGETQLTAALLRFDPQDIVAQVAASGPINVATPEVGGSYDPYAADAPLEIYATGIRNAYDLLWHSNGHIYVPTNGTAGGGNSPGVDEAGGTLTMTSASPLNAQTGFDQGTDVTDVCATRRIDGQPYTGGDVPAIDGHPTQLDYLFDVEQGGYYGHPNPTRCEWVLNDGSDSPQNTGRAYPAGTEADPNYQGFAYNFDFNKSPNGVIEYMSPTFDGALQGRMMVVRFSGNDDILTMQVADNGEVLGAQNGTDIDGFTGYADPLELTEDTEVNPGNIYINQFNRGGEPQQLYLLRVPADQLSGGLRATPERLIMSATLNNEQPSDTDAITVTNTGDEAATVAAAVSGPNAADFTVQTAGTIPAGEDEQFTITFNPAGTTTGTRTATVTFTSGEDTETVNVRALAFTGQFGGEEPTLQQVTDTFELGIDTGWSGLAGGTDPGAKGDEVLEPLFQRADDGPVIMTPIASFAPFESLPFGYYTDDAGTAITTEVGVLANGQQQTLNPSLSSGGTTFDPGDATFGLYYFSNTFNRTGYTEDARNDSGGLHRARIYPLAGDDRYLVAFEDASNGDYQDYVFILDNITPAEDPGSGGGGEPTGDAIRVNFQSETAAVPEGYLRDYGQAYGSRTGADQGTGLTYGWVDDETFEPLSLVGNGRDRNSNDNQLLDTLMHMDLPPDNSGGTLADGSWQVAVADGDYEVTVTVGDANNGSAPESHTINVEGVNAIDGFGKSTAPNGSDTRHMTATVTVEVADGALTIDQIGGENTKINYVDIVPVGDQPGQTVAQVNFQPAPSPTPTDWVADSGQLFTAARGYGWVRTEGGASKTTDTRDRTQDPDPLTGTLILVDDSQIPAVVDGEWEYALADGEYIVEVSVGDPGFADSTHAVTAEGTTVVGPFTPSGPGDYQTGSATVSVEDGALTLASSGSNTKMQWVRILATAGGDVVPPQVTIDLDGEGSNGVYTGPVAVTVTATDRTLEFTEYTVDGGPSQNYTGPFEVSGVGDHIVEVTATDGAGNSTTRTAEFTIVQLNNGDLTVTNPEAAPFNDRLVMSRIQSDVDNPMTKETGTAVLGNSGSDPVQVSAVDIAGDGFELVSPPPLPFTIPVGGQQPIVVKFVGVGSGRNQLFESDLVITHDGADGPTSTIELAGLWQVQEEGGNEPTLTQISAAYGLGTTIVGSGQKLNNEGRLEAVGDEVLSKTWRLVDESQPATVRQLAAYHTCCNNTAAFGHHPPGAKSSFSVVLRHDGQWAQSLLPRTNNSDTQPAFANFNPASVDFSFRIDPESSDWTLNNTSPDDCNPAGGNQGKKDCQLGHHLRIWPAEDRAGNPIPGTYLVAMDYAGINYDFNDNVYLVTNIAPSP